MSDPEHGDRGQSRIAKDDLDQPLGGRVAVVASLGVLDQPFAQLGHFFEERDRDLLGLGLEVAELISSVAVVLVSPLKLD